MGYIEQNDPFAQRKQDHITLSLDSSNQAEGLSGFDTVSLAHDSLPEIDFSEVTLKSDCLGSPLETPFFIAGMTAGHPEASRLNLLWARACESRGWAMGVGSQRRELEGQALSGAGDGWIELREQCPRLILFSNLGISQVIHASTKAILEVIESIEAQGLVIHLNALQEVLQPEGTPVFRGAIQKIETLCRELPVPVILKETGCGFSPATLQKIKNLGVAAVDVSGLGGTHWGRIEGARAQKRLETTASISDLLRARAAQTFNTWGTKTTDSLRAARAVLPASVEIWASGGIRSGLDAAKAVALGAHRVGFAKPALDAALETLKEWGPINGKTEPKEFEKTPLLLWMHQMEFEMKVALFCTGSKNLNELRSKEVQ